ncbi:hypothetical protein UPYG_G00006930 [Umbra pygmaea]|uniref:Uncharacterized protein n=1 Tax=Umbra pygmaea TaxID=75934 RepID=A0ABD0Y1X6_UMBPY
MEAVYSRFDSYDFEGDPNFQSGLKDLKSSSEEHFLGIKLFFYNRFVEPIDFDGYKQRSSTSANVQNLEKFNNLTTADSEPVVCGSSTGMTSVNTDEPLSFQEVIRLVQAGQEVPGLSKLDIKPNNQNPTPSQMERRRKPWENS